MALRIALVLFAGLLIGGCPDDPTPGPAADGAVVVLPDTEPLPDGEDIGLDVDAGDLGPSVCIGGELRCAGAFSVERCVAAGTAWEAIPCATDEGCDDGGCVPQTCTPGKSAGECIDTASHSQCKASGSEMEIIECGIGSYCYVGKCIPQLCVPDSTICKGFTQLKVCNDDGTAWVDGASCPPGSACLDGKCLSPCEVNIKNGSYLGCEYWALDLDNIEDAEFQDVGVVVSVPADKPQTSVVIIDTMTGASLTAPQLGALTLNVASGSTGVFKLPLGRDVDGSLLTNRTFKIVTTSPVIVHQFNPLNGEGVYTNDASLLLPSKVTGQDYFVMAWPHRVAGSTLRGFATIVASQPGQTKIDVTPTAPVVAATDGSVGAMVAGETYSFTLNEGQALNIESDGENGMDLTGTFVHGSKRVTVIAGHECANVPLGISACDHLEQQLFPLETWANEYIADYFKPRSASQLDIWRVMAGESDVTVTTDPPVFGYETFKLQRGGWVEFASNQTFKVSADGKILVGHYLTGSSYPGAAVVCENTGIGKDTAIGDPAFTLAVPVTRYLKEYAVLTPEGYAENYFNIIAPDGAVVTLDGAPVSSPWVPIPGTGFSMSRPVVQPGIHALKSVKAFGLTAYGYDCDVSYAYPGGLRLQAFNGGTP